LQIISFKGQNERILGTDNPTPVTCTRGWFQSHTLCP